MNTGTEPSWRHNPYVWMIIAIPMAAVVFGIYMITIAIKSNDGLVVDDYYKKGKEINMVLVRDELAASLGLAAEIEIGDKMVGVRLTARAAIPEDQDIVLSFYNATRADNDISINLMPARDGAYTGQMKQLPQGYWNVELGTNQWRLTGRLESIAGSSARLKLAAGSN